ncbi:bifunctional serine/threonine-protein kinase/ABC transporter substrate-binding protein [Streptomyces poriticola]|uniref:bifunctional serine/threonine-protein kinase/ABC transporter substrate-binding protein n=1 Tax=Streptomyces poriticola TaxID=3120506 RepID=UPI002FCE459F
MEPLHPTDPSSIAGHRLLGRLGAGGMGVVHLARSTGGALVALKVVHAEYAQEPGFRERFRREVDTLRRVDNPWVVPLVAADPEAPAPWLATAFVAGPSLAEAVAVHGPLPARSARVLGRRLAEALRDVHAAGLVHRDVKPGNVLLALDGPRLIDFGIAREPGDTALTATGVVVGTPGFLAPEQVEGVDRTSVGPPSDVFALGCVLAYALTGRPPFGTGPVDALLFRAVHESADLDGVPEELAPLLRSCLEKDPALRPSAADLVRMPGVASEAGDEGGSGPRADGMSAPGAGGAADPAARVGPSWLPDAVTRLVAARSVEGAVLPDIEPTRLDADAAVRARQPGPAGAARDGDATAQDDTTGPDGGAPGAGGEVPGMGGEAPGRGDEVPAADGEVPGRGREVPGPEDETPGPEDERPKEASGGLPGRRRFLLLAGGVAALAAGGAVSAAWWWGDDSSSRTPGGDAGPTRAIGLQADLSGEAKRIGVAQERGVRLAVEEFNARRDAPFTLSLDVRDDGGDPQRAAKAARELVADPDVVAVLGPTTDATAEAALPVHDSALMPLVTVSAGAVKLLGLGSRSLVQARPHDSLLPFFLSAHLRGTARSRSIGIVNDRAAGDHAWEIAGTLSRILNQDGHPYVPEVMSALREDFGPTVDALLGGGADSVVFAGPPERGAGLARTLHGRGFTGARAGAHGLLDPRFLDAAGEAAEGWVIAAPVLDAAAHPGARKFAAAHTARFDAAPDPFAAEAYDAAGLVLHALTGLPDRRRNRKNLTTALRAATYQGITQTMSFSRENGARTVDGKGVHLWRVEDGRFRYTGPAEHVVSG